MPHGTWWSAHSASYQDKLASTAARKAGLIDEMVTVVIILRPKTAVGRSVRGSRSQAPTEPSAVCTQLDYVARIDSRWGTFYEGVARLAWQWLDNHSGASPSRLLGRGRGVGSERWLESDDPLDKLRAAIGIWATCQFPSTSPASYGAFTVAGRL